MGDGARGLLGRRRRAGTTSRTTTRAAAPTAGARTGCSASAIAQCRLCFALALWNGARPDPQGAAVRPDRPRGQPRRGREGVLLLPRLDADALVHEGALQVPAGASSRTRGSSRRTAGAGGTSREFELADTGVFDDDRYFDVFAEYAKASPDDMLIRITVANRGPEAAPLHVLPTLWFRNTWSWGRTRRGLRATAAHRSATRDARRSRRARDARALPLRGDPSGAAAAAALHRERDQHRAPLRRAERRRRT